MGSERVKMNKIWSPPSEQTSMWGESDRYVQKGEDRGRERLHLGVSANPGASVDSGVPASLAS